MIQGLAKHEFLASGHLHTRIKSVNWAYPSSGRSKKHLFAVGCESGAIDVFDAISGSTVATLVNSKSVQGHTASVNDACFDTGGYSSFSHHQKSILPPPIPYADLGLSLQVALFSLLPRMVVSFDGTFRQGAMSASLRQISETTHEHTIHTLFSYSSSIPTLETASNAL